MHCDTVWTDARLLTMAPKAVGGAGLVERGLRAAGGSSMPGRLMPHPP